MEENLKGKPNCKICGIKKGKENTYIWNSKFSSYCKSCEKNVTLMNKRRLNNTLKGRGKKVWEKTNKNHYPDPDWVWQQIENNESPAKFMEKLEQKYALSKHGNSGKNNRWKNKNNNIK